MRTSQKRVLFLKIAKASMLIADTKNRVSIRDDSQGWKSQ